MSENKIYNLLQRDDKLSRSIRPNPFLYMQQHPLCFRVKGLTFVWGNIRILAGYPEVMFSKFIVFFKFHGFLYGITEEIEKEKN